jgi:hypothetical protein
MLFLVLHSTFVALFYCGNPAMHWIRAFNERHADALERNIEETPYECRSGLGTMARR